MIFFHFQFAAFFIYFCSVFFFFISTLHYFASNSETPLNEMKAQFRHIRSLPREWYHLHFFRKLWPQRPFSLLVAKYALAHDLIKFSSLVPVSAATTAEPAGASHLGFASVAAAGAMRTHGVLWNNSFPGAKSAFFDSGVYTPLPPCLCTDDDVARKSAKGSICERALGNSVVLGVFWYSRWRNKWGEAIHSQLELCSHLQEHGSTIKYCCIITCNK